MAPKYKEFGKIQIDEARIDETCNAYFKWKDLNSYISNQSHRGINMPDAISEPMGCYCLGFDWNRGDEVGDATAPDGRKIEFKATSRFEGDLSSFGPKCTFDDLVFLRFDTDNNLLFIYDLHINSEEFGKLPANSKETIQDQKDAGRRLQRKEVYGRAMKYTYKVQNQEIPNLVEGRVLSINNRDKVSRILVTNIGLKESDITFPIDKIKELPLYKGEK